MSSSVSEQVLPLSKKVVSIVKGNGNVINSKYRSMLMAFYEEHNPAKCDDVDKLLVKYKGKETKLFAALQKKYPNSVQKLNAKPIEQLENADVAKNKVTQGHSIPKGFFEDAGADAKARNVDVKAIRKKAEEDDFAAFLSFSATLQKEDVEEAKLIQKDHLRDIEVFNHEQKGFKDLVKELKRKRQNINSNRKSNISETNNTKSVSIGTQETGSVNVRDILEEKRRKKKQKQETNTNKKGELSWRSKCSI